MRVPTLYKNDTQGSSARALFALGVLLPSSLLLCAAAVPQPSRAHRPKAAKSAAGDAFNTALAPTVKKYCFACHSGTGAQAGIVLDHDRDTAAVLKDRKTWEAVSRNLADRHMPPPSAPQPTDAERDKAAAWIDGVFTKADCQINDPGHVTLRRLNREEYDNTIRDLFGVDSIKLANGQEGRPADDFPSDDVGYGFDNIGDVLSLSPLLMEKYVNAAERITQKAILTPEQGAAPVHLDLASAVSTTSGGKVGTTGRGLSSNGEVTTFFDAPRPGEYTITAVAYEDHAGPEFAKMDFRVDGKTIRTEDVTTRRNNPKPYTAKVDFKPGRHKVGFAFTNGYYQAADPATKKRQQDRNLYIYSADVVGPPGLPETLPASHKRIMTCRPGDGLTDEQAARKILTPLASRIYRRPVQASEIARLVKYVHVAEQQGESFERGIQIATDALLCSPNFLFRVEVDPKPNDKNSSRLLNDYELASRLSYFLWSSMPDDQLFALAAKGALHRPEVLAAQAKRMLKDPKARALADNFAGQWLQLRNLANVAPDTNRYPEFNDKLRASMKTETEMFFEAIVNEDRSILDFIDGKYTYINGPLAKLYNIDGVDGDYFRRVSLTGDERGGILTQASILTVTSNPTRTSPVKRGKWVMEQILGTPPPPPPPNVPKLADDKKEPLTGTLRQRMEQHRKNPICASCHTTMDAIGFGMENFDPVGKWRSKDGDSPIDATGTLPGGRKFAGPVQLEKVLLAQKSQFVKCLSEKMLTYALGRGLQNYDTCKITDIVSTVAKHDYRFSSLVTAVVTSEPFRKRRGDGGH
jgi:mono/diheme cytochrome c family protein